MDFDDIPSIKPYQNDTLLQSIERNEQKKKNKSDNRGTTIDSYLSDAFIKTYFTYSQSKK